MGRTGNGRLGTIATQGPLAGAWTPRRQGRRGGKEARATAVAFRLKGLGRTLLDDISGRFSGDGALERPSTVNVWVMCVILDMRSWITLLLLGTWLPAIAAQVVVVPDLPSCAVSNPSPHFVCGNKQLMRPA